MDLEERGLEGVDWIHLAQDMDQWWAVVNMLMNLWVQRVDFGGVLPGCNAVWTCR
jgi:hypothetical protein